MRVLVTGAGGFVGLHLVRRFSAGGAEVDALVRRPPDGATEAFLGDHASRVTWRFGDVTDRDACEWLVAERKPDVVVHAAAVTFTGDRERAEPARVFDVNAGGTLNLLEAARRHGAGTFVYVSSGGLYGAAPPVPALDETAEMRPVTMYAVAKIASEHLCGRYAALSDLRVRVGRLGTAYGPMERASGSRSNLSAVQQVVAAAALAAGGGAAGGALRVAGADVARDFCHIDDVAEAFWQLAVARGLPELVYNVGVPVSEPLAVALDVVAAEVPGFSWTPVPAGEAADVRQVPAQARAAMDVTRLVRDTPWRPRFPLADGVRAYLAWRRGHTDVVALAEASD